MEVNPQRRQFALDTNVILDLANDLDAAWTLHEICQERRAALAISPTVVQELAHQARDSRHVAHSLSLKALKSLRSWGIAPFDLKSVGHGITEVFSENLRRRKLLPEAERNDGLILAEVALANIPLLITSDPHILNIATEDLRRAFEDGGMGMVNVISPRRFLKSMENGK